MSPDRSISIASARVLRPENHERLKQASFTVHEHDLLKIKLLQLQSSYIADATDPLIITSIHAVRSLLQWEDAVLSPLLSRRVYAIAGRTSDTLREAGFTDVREAVSGKCLAENIIAAHEASAVYITTADRMDVIETMLAFAKIPVHIELAYLKEKINYTYPEHDAILCFSPSQIDAYLQANTPVEDRLIVCIGETTASHARSLSLQNILIADQSSESSVVQAVINHYSS